MPSNFVDDFFNGNAEHRRRVLKDAHSKQAITTDKWDRLDHQDMLRQVKELEIAEIDLQNFVDTGQPAMADMFFALLQAMPEHKEPGDLAPKYRVNGAVAAEAQNLKEYLDLRAYTVSDQISASLSSASLEPNLEVIFDKLNEAKKMAGELQKAMEGYSRGEDEMSELMKQLSEGMADGSLTDEEIQDLKDKIDKLQEQMEQAEAEAQQKSDQLDQELDNNGHAIREQLAEGMKEAAGKAEGEANFGMLWGNDPGEFKKMDPKKRLELAERMNNPRFRKLAELIGPMIHCAVGAQRDKVHYVPEEVYDIELGNDLHRLIPLELVNLMHPALKYDFMRRFMEGSLVQYVMRGTEKQAKGGIIACADGSGSMGGEKEIWAMATCLALLRIAKNQKRPFTGIQFGSPGQYRKWVFDTSGKGFSCDVTGSGMEPQHHEGVDAIMDYAGTFLNGGTDFMTPYNVAIEQLAAEHAAEGAVDGDIVFITDGLCAVTDEWKREYHETKKVLGFKSFGVAIACPANSEPLAELCDYNVISVTEMVATAPKNIFGMV